MHLKTILPASPAHLLQRTFFAVARFSNVLDISTTLLRFVSPRCSNTARYFPFPAHPLSNVITSFSTCCWNREVDPRILVLPQKKSWNLAMINGAMVDVNEPEFSRSERQPLSGDVTKSRMLRPAAVQSDTAAYLCTVMRLCLKCVPAAEEVFFLN